MRRYHRAALRDDAADLVGLPVAPSATSGLDCVGWACLVGAPQVVCRACRPRRPSGMAKVYRAQDIARDRCVVCKRRLDAVRP